jgi:hypothetical protein
MTFHFKSIFATLVKKKVFVNRPYDLFLLTSVLLVLSSFCMLGQTLDIHLHDTYYVFPAVYLIWTTALIFLFAWTVYKLTNRFLLTKYLTWFHVAATLIVLLMLIISKLWYNEPVLTNEREPLSFRKLFEIQRKEQITAVTISILFIAGQIGYFLNLVGGLFRRR